MKVEGYGCKCTVSLELSGNSDNKVQIKAADQGGIIFYTSHVIDCPSEDYNSVQMVAMAALENWDSTMPIGLGSYVNQELEADWPAGGW